MFSLQTLTRGIRLYLLVGTWIDYEQDLVSTLIRIDPPQHNLHACKVVSIHVTFIASFKILPPMHSNSTS